MELSEFVLRLMLLFLPGIICSQVVDSLTVHRKRAPSETLIRCFLFGLGAYVFCWVVVCLIGGYVNKQFHLHWSTHLTFLDALQDRRARLSFGEIAYVCAGAFILGLLISATQTHKLFYRFARALKISRKSGELDVWGYIFNSPTIQFATVRDHKHDLVYDGWIQSFSDDAKTSELFLRDVCIYRNSTGKLLYDIGALYVCVDAKEMAIEFRDIAFTVGFLNMRRKAKGENEREEVRKDNSFETE